MIRIYETSTGFSLFKRVHARNVGWSVLDVALSPDSRHLIYTSWCDYSKSDTRKLKYFASTKASF